ncbi:phytoene/squalene synthase family protein [Haloplanus rubicundus]|uniref:Squalene/phytoene synthase family protein n=1 Tax=Haloplanus rubicundus TaxID=1547898 RepID=A0A345EBP9_9EURY|nr:phytoene/squalene synthase family protein [Haloplanus rubicundus]AXG09621.1 squalene/phytoene synthase family protein [Haloplanus rubicundus]
MSRHAARPPGDRADLEWCHEAVQGVSRTFALTVDVLDEPMASYICIGYLLCRVPDTIEDADHVPPTEQARLLREYDRVLDPADETGAEDFRASVDEWLPEPEGRSEDWNVVASTPRIVRTFEALPEDVREAVTPPARELVQGMAMFVERYADEGGLRIQSREELEEYCYYAAGTVGNLVTNLLARGDLSEGRRARLYDTAEEFGLLLQLVNVAKDVYDDYTEEDNVYLPAEWLAAEDVPQDEVLAPEHASGAAAVVRRTARHARSFLDDAQTYLETVPTTDGNTVAAWAIPFLLAVGTLRELLERPEDALSATGVKISRQEVFAVVTEMTGTPSDSLADLREDIAGQPYHRASGQAD